jgi:hypothetical protein
MAARRVGLHPGEVIGGPGMAGHRVGLHPGDIIGGPGIHP